MIKENNQLKETEHQLLDKLNALSKVIDTHKHCFQNGSDKTILKILDDIKMDFLKYLETPRNIYMVEEIYKNAEKDRFETATHIFADEDTARNLLKAQALKELDYFIYRGYTKEQLEELGSKFYEDGANNVYYQTDTHCTYYTLHTTTPLTKEEMASKLLEIKEEHRKLNVVLDYKKRKEDENGI